MIRGFLSFVSVACAFYHDLSDIRIDLCHVCMCFFERSLRRSRKMIHIRYNNNSREIFFHGRSSFEFPRRTRRRFSFAFLRSIRTDRLRRAIAYFQPIVSPRSRHRKRFDVSFNFRERFLTVVNLGARCTGTAPCRRIAVPLRVSGCHCFSNYPVEAERRALERSSISSSFAIEIIWRHGLRLSLILPYYDTGTLPHPTLFLIHLHYYNFLFFNVI